MPYGIQQPAISGQISQLEKTVGVKLFHRRPFGLTASGARLFAEIEAFFAGLPELASHIRGQATQRLRVAAPGTILRNYLPAIFADYKRRFPDFRLTLHDANQASAEELLRKHEIDLAITELEGKPPAPIKSSVLVRLPLVLVVHEKTQYQSSRDFFRKEGVRESLISLPANEVISKHFHAGLRKLRLAWPPRIEVSSLELIDLYTSLGFGVGLSIAVPGSEKKKGLRVLPLRNFSPLTIALLWIGEPSNLAETFLAEIKSVALQLLR